MIRRGCRGGTLPTPQHPVTWRRHLMCASVGAALPTKQITPRVFRERRRQFLRLMAPNSIVIFPAADDAVASHDILHPFRQESVFYHLFGVSEPMRRAHSPTGCASEAEGFKLTCAVLAKYDGVTTGTGDRDGSGGGGGGGDTTCETATRLFVPDKTVDVGVLPWSQQSRSLSDFERATLTEEEEEEEGEKGKEDVGVLANDVTTVMHSATALIARMTEVAAMNRAHAAELLPPGGARVKPGILKSSNPLPRLYVNLPRQLRWTGEVYHLPEGRHLPRGTPRASFTHPLEALIQLLYATEVTVEHFGMANVTLRCHYLRPSGRPLLPGISPPDSQRQHDLQAIFPDQLHRQCTRQPARQETTSAGAGAETAPPAVALGSPIQLPSRLIDSYRLCKSPEQVAQHLYSAAATHVAFLAAMREAARGCSERAIHKAFCDTISDLSVSVTPTVSVRSAYIPVVAVGQNATQIHYTANNSSDGRDGDLCRLDAGVELDLVPTDCTRTFPVGAGQEFWSDAASRKRALYDGLLCLQRRLLGSLQCGAELAAVGDLHVSLTAKLIGELSGGGRGNGLEDGTETPDAKGEVEAVRRVLCAHYFGHPFGLDIHEALPSQTLTARRPRTFSGGMMHTVEPGVYIPAHDSPLYTLLRELWPSAAEPLSDLCGVGAQIEDDVLVLPPSTSVGGGEGSDGSDCPWTRGEYLSAVCEVYHELERANWEMFFACSLDNAETPATAGALLRQYRETLPRMEWVALLVVFTQRAAFHGAVAALRHLPSDASRVVGGKVELGDGAWYPFASIILTAYTPKDAAAMQHVMREARTPTAA